MPAALPYSHGVKRTGPVHLHSCCLHVCLFCFFLKVHRPPLDSYESHAGGGAAELKVCHRGEAPVAGLKSPIAVQSPRQEGPAQEQRRAGEGPALRAGNTLCHQHAAWTDMVSLGGVCHCCAVDEGLGRRRRNA